MTLVDPAQKRRALELARAAIAAAIREKRRVAATGELAVTIAGVFVSLHIRGRLRGCIGTTTPEILGPAIQRMAIAAATRDPRFDPVDVSEIEHIDIEISVLTPPEPIAGPADVTVGVHGLAVETPARRGLLLPQVASERGMSADQFVDALCVKAGIDRASLADPDTVLWRFEAVVFGER